MIIAVNIGRNIGNLPMSRSRWIDYQGAVENVLTAEHKLVGFGTGTSIWGTIPEEFATYHVVTAWGLSDATNRALAALAADYSQDAIGIMTESNLIYATEMETE